MTQLAELFYDDRCGPCTLWARSFEGLSHGRLAILPLSSPSADRSLGDLPEEARYGAMHLIQGGRRSSGAQGVVPLVGMVLGATVQRVLEGAPLLGGGARSIYRRFWWYRRTHGCASPGARE